MNTLLLDLDNWDLVVDLSGNIAVAASPYAVSQDVASACRTFVGECWYDTERGIPYFELILGKFPPLALVKAQLSSAALTVPGCADPVVYLNAMQDRTLTGQVQFTETSTGTTQVAGINNQFILGSSILGGGNVI